MVYVWLRSWLLTILGLFVMLHKMTLLYITRLNSTAHDTRDHILLIVGLIYVIDHM